MAQSSQSENLCGQCRICMEIKTNQISVFKDDVSEKIIQLADVVMYPDDGLPTSICTDCEVRLNGCYEFREQVQYADKKFRENLSYSQVEIEECIVKQEMGSYSAKNESMTGENYHSDNVNESSDDEDDHRSALQELEATVDPLNHVEVMDFTEPSDETSMHDVPMGHEEPLIEAREQIEPESDPLTTGLKEELAGLETDSRPSTSTAVRKNETPRELTVQSQVADISEKNSEEMVEQLSGDVEFLGAHNNVQTSRDFNQQHNSNLQLKNLSEDRAYDTQHGLNEIGTGAAIPSTDKNLVSDRNVQNSQSEQSSNQTQGDQLRKLLTQKIESPVNQGMKVTKQDNLESSNNSNLNDIQLSINRNLPYSVNPQTMVIGHNSTYNETEPQMYTLQLSIQKPLLNQVNPALLVSNILPIITNVTLTKPKSTIKKRRNNLNLSKVDALSTGKQTGNNPTKKVPKPAAIKQLSDSYCEPCNIDCGSAILLDEHKEGALFICRICASNFNSHKLLEGHFVTHKLLFTCSTCGLKYYTRNDLLNHEKVTPACKPQNVKCTICQKTIKNKKALKAHMKNIHGEENWPCHVCGKSFKRKHLLNCHLKSTHIAYEHIKCEHCPKIFLGPENLKTHILNNHTMINDIDAFKVTCPTCGLVLKNQLTFRKHILTHDIQTCELCGESFQGCNAFNYHKRKSHPKKGIFPCSKCDKTFTLSWDLLEHKRIQHTIRSKKKDSFCEICGKIYRGNIKMHYLMHSGERNFECPICKQRFTQSVTRDTHMRVHSDVGKYNCIACGKTFRWKQTMENHVKKCTNNMDYIIM